MIQTIQNVSDCEPLYLPHSLYLKPVAKINISIRLPEKVTAGQTVSNYEVMEKIRQMILPDKFAILKVSKSTLEFIRFEAEIDDRSKLEHCLARLAGRPIKMAGFTESVKIRATERKDDFPTRHDWDSFFRDATNMDEMKAGERPDTIFLSNLPIKWFAPRHQVDKNQDNLKPSESIFKRIFEKFGNVRCVDIPICDPYRTQMKAHMSGIKTFSHEQETYFEGYVQFSEYVGFVEAMNAFRGMKLVHKEIDKNQAVNIHVDFDKTKHLSDLSVRRRQIVRDRLIEKDRAAEEEEKKRVQAEEEKQEKERKRLALIRETELTKQQERENKRKEKHLKKLREKETTDLSHKIRAEEKKLLLTQRKLESVRLVEALFERIRTKIENGRQTTVKEEKGYEKRRDAIVIKSEPGVSSKLDLRNKLAQRYRNEQEKNYRVMQDRVKRVRDGTMLQNFLGADRRSPGIDAISSLDSEFSDLEENGGGGKKKKKKKKRKADSSSSETSDSEGDSDEETSSSSSDEEARSKKKKAPLVPVAPTPYMPGYPPAGVYNPETGEMQMPMYPYPFFPAGGMAPMRGGYYPTGGYRGTGYRGPPRGRFPRVRGRGGPYRGRGGSGYPPYGGQYDDDEYYRYFKHKSGYDDSEYHDDRRRSYSRSRSRSRRRSYSRSRSRSYSRSRSRRKSRSRSRSKSKKLVSTLRKSDSHSWSRSPSRSRDKRRRHKSRSTWSREGSPRDDASPRGSSRHAKNNVALEPDKLIRTAKEIQRSVQQKLAERAQGEAELKKNLLEFEAEEMEKQFAAENSPTDKATAASSSPTGRQKRSVSVDSSKFRSPKRRERSTSGEKTWH